jgi:putative oxidoreductase
MKELRRFEYAAFVLRVALGLVFIAHGLLKVLVYTLPGTVQFFESAGFMGWLAYPVAIAEIGGGVLLVTGIGTRYVAIGLLPVLLGALSIHFGNGWVYTNPNGGWEYVVFLLAASIAQALLGDGAFAVTIPHWPRVNQQSATVTVTQR